MPVSLPYTAYTKISSLFCVASVSNPSGEPNNMSKTNDNTRIEQLENQIRQKDDTIKQLKSQLQRHDDAIEHGFECGVCMENVGSNGDEIVTTVCCSNVFCRICLEKSIKVSGECPMCRYSCSETDTTGPKPRGKLIPDKLEKYVMGRYGPDYAGIMPSDINPSGNYAEPLTNYAKRSVQIQNFFDSLYPEIGKNRPNRPADVYTEYAIRRRAEKKKNTLHAFLAVPIKSFLGVRRVLGYWIMIILDSVSHLSHESNDARKTNDKPPSSSDARIDQLENQLRQKDEAIEEFKAQLQQHEDAIEQFKCGVCMEIAGSNGDEIVTTACCTNVFCLNCLEKSIFQKNLLTCLEKSVLPCLKNNKSYCCPMCRFACDGASQFDKWDTPIEHVSQLGKRSVPIQKFVDFLYPDIGSKRRNRLADVYTEYGIRPRTQKQETLLDEDIKRRIQKQTKLLERRFDTICFRTIILIFCIFLGIFLSNENIVEPHTPFSPSPSLISLMRDGSVCSPEEAVSPRSEYALSEDVEEDLRFKQCGTFADPNPADIWDIIGPYMRDDIIANLNPREYPASEFRQYGHTGTELRRGRYGYAETLCMVNYSYWRLFQQIHEEMKKYAFSKDTTVFIWSTIVKKHNPWRKPFEDDFNGIVSEEIGFTEWFNGSAFEYWSDQMARNWKPRRITSRPLEVASPLHSAVSLMRDASVCLPHEAVSPRSEYALSADVEKYLRLKLCSRFMHSDTEMILHHAGTGGLAESSSCVVKYSYWRLFLQQIDGAIKKRAFDEQMTFYIWKIVEHEFGPWSKPSEDAFEGTVSEQVERFFRKNSSDGDWLREYSKI